MPIFRVKFVKIYTGQKNLHKYIRGVHDKYQVCSCVTFLLSSHSFRLFTFGIVKGERAIIARNWIEVTLFCQNITPIRWNFRCSMYLSLFLYLAPGNCSSLVHLSRKDSSPEKMSLVMKERACKRPSLVLVPYKCIFYPKKNILSILSSRASKQTAPCLKWIVLN